MLMARCMGPFHKHKPSRAAPVWRCRAPWTELTRYLVRLGDAHLGRWHWDLQAPDPRHVQYRNQGADYGRILVGLQVPAKDDKAAGKFLQTLGYPYAEETDNPVYRLFLRG